MTIATVPVYDATHAGIASLPPGQAAGYSTGSGIVPWTAADWAAHPGAVRIDQSPVNTALDELCDVLDVERGAATTGDCPSWCEAAAANFAAGKRPGQRHPAIYMSLDSVTAVVNALIAAGITEGPGLWIANWNLTEAGARIVVQLAGGPFPVIGVQYGNRGSYDVSVFSVPWLQAVSGGGAPPAPPANWTEILMQTLPTLAQGASGEDVRTLQGALIARGHAVRVDGSFGPATAAAVMAAQRSFGFTGPDVDGKAGPKTWPKLFNR
jgi:hypothetical protein